MEKELDLDQVLQFLGKVPKNYKLRNVNNLSSPLGLGVLKGYHKSFEVDHKNKVVYIKFKSL